MNTMPQTTNKLPCSTSLPRDTPGTLVVHAVTNGRAPSRRARRGFGEWASEFVAITLCWLGLALPAAADFTSVSWQVPNPLVVSNTITLTVHNAGGSVAANFRAFKNTDRTPIVVTPQSATLGTGSNPTVTLTVPTGLTANDTLYFCAYGSWNIDACTAGYSDENSSVSATLTPITSAPYWKVSAQVKTTSSAAAAALPPNGIDLSALSANALAPTTAAPYAWLFSCAREGAPPEVQTPQCSMTFEVDNGAPASTLTFPAAQSPYTLYFKGADASGNLKVCAGAPPWNAQPPSNACKPVWNDGRVLALKSITVSTGATPNIATQTILVARNIPLPAPFLTIANLSPASLTATPGGSLPTVTVTVNRQTPSAPPQSGLTCGLTIQTTPPTQYNCTALSSIQSATTASCSCTPPANATAPANAASYPVEVTASATGATSAPSPNASLTVQATAANSRGCTDDPNVPISRIVRVLENEMPNPTYGTYWPQQTILMNVFGETTPPQNPQHPTVVAVKIVVPPTGAMQWGAGSIQIGAGGPGSADGVLHRCRGRFNEPDHARGLVKVFSLKDYNGPDKQSASTFFANWVVGQPATTDLFTAQIERPGTIANDGWPSDGVYYINVKQTYCVTVNGGYSCGRQFGGLGTLRQ